MSLEAFAANALLSLIALQGCVHLKGSEPVFKWQAWETFGFYPRPFTKEEILGSRTDYRDPAFVQEYQQIPFTSEHTQCVCGHSFEAHKVGTCDVPGCFCARYRPDPLYEDQR